MKIIKYLKGIHWLIYIILFFCLAGIFRNAYHMSVFGFNYENFATKILVAMAVIYVSQVILILLREKKAWLISAIQALFCAYVYEDFTFLPVTELIKNILWQWFPNMGYGWVKFMGTTMISALFTLEILKTYILFALTEELPRKKTRKRSAKKEDIISQQA